MTTYRLAEVETHNTKGSAWMVIHNKVYDVTNFMQEHPGGEEVLLDVLGVDASESFEDVGHSNDARDLLKDYLLGDLDPEDCTKSVKKGNYVWQATDKKEDKTKESNSTMILIGGTVLLIVAGVAYNLM